MITFHVLGTLDLRGPDGGHLGSPLSGSKRLALLSYLALATPRALHRRDTLLALLWPGSDDARARNALSNMVYQIRRSLGRESLVSSGDDEIGLTRGALWCDAVAFEEALDEGHPEEALELYRGDLLEGFFVSGAAPEFDQWLEAERARFRRRAADAARTLAERAERAEDWNEATRWARRTLTFDPYDERSARRLISLLDHSGDRGGALRAYASLKDLLGREFQAEPAAETRALIQAVRARTEPGEADDRHGSADRTASSRATVHLDGAGPPGAACELPVRSIAVLPFDNLSGTEDAEPFAAGLHDDLLTELSRISTLTVIARTSVLSYRSTDRSVPEIARELGVGTLVEGGVQSSGGRLRLNVQLIDARSGAHRWVERYDRELSTDSIFEVQSELVEKIAASLRAELSPREKGAIGMKTTDDLEAYRLHAQGRHRLYKRTEAPLREAVAYLNEAIERDPTYALAWAGLADALSLLHDYGYEDAESVLPRAEEAVRRALELDPTLAAAHASLGLLHSNRREGTDSVRELRQAIELGPSYADAHNWLSWISQCLGMLEQALESSRRAVELDPLAPEALSNLSVSLLANGEAEAAVDEARRLREFEPGWSTAPFYEGLALYRLGRYEEACTALQDLAVPWVGPGPQGALAVACVGCGDDAALAELMARFEEEADHFSIGLVHAARGEPERAFDAFGRVDNWGDYWPTLSVQMYYPDVLGPLRDDPRFEEIQAVVNRSWGVDADGGSSAHATRGAGGTPG